MNWTDQWPTQVCRFYYWRKKPGDEPDVCYVSWKTDAGHRAIFCNNLGMDRYIETCGGQWAGPIPWPTE